MRNQREKTREEMSWWTLHRWVKDRVDSGSGVVRDCDANALWGRMPEESCISCIWKVYARGKRAGVTTSHLNVDREVCL